MNYRFAKSSVEYEGAEAYISEMLQNLRESLG